MSIQKRVCALLAILNLFMMAACSSEEKKVDPGQVIDNIKLTLVEEHKDYNGTGYTLKIANNSDETIIQNNVYVSFPVKIEKDSRSNPFKIEARNNKVNIQPGEEVRLMAWVPKAILQGTDQWELENPEIEIKGYVNEISDINHFFKSGNARLMADF
ncbi:hypothetical protein Q5741_16465 [Paenibacillus sp. JX-17]|uniref:DUF4352 domain-containing protein n=1 Tax=Paenibacillus lacisoli TaxID=3064525 RepID=A0ABT9CJ95_9BACL|nr:hypothetical protein [Paenibacillus sp. JX-17]MDO7908007.1 hypothetical protein [Paenibacillus sp. JX-17]